jgi:hypothetical protein
VGLEQFAAYFEFHGYYYKDEIAAVVRIYGEFYGNFMEFYEEFYGEFYGEFYVHFCSHRNNIVFFSFSFFQKHQTIDNVKSWAGKFSVLLSVEFSV